MICDAQSNTFLASWRARGSEGWRACGPNELKWLALKMRLAERLLGAVSEAAFSFDLPSPAW